MENQTPVATTSMEVVANSVWPSMEDQIPIATTSMEDHAAAVVPAVMPQTFYIIPQFVRSLFKIGF